MLGTGYGWVQAGLGRQSLLALPLWVVLALPFAKIAATSLSIGSGGSGGIFGPGMVIGGLLGASLWRLLEPIAPAMPPDPAPFVIVAMMALFGSIAHAPLAVMLMVAEMTGNLGMLAPAMIAIGLATLVVGDRTIYRSQLKNRTESPAHRFRYAMPLMASIPAGDAARQPRLVLPGDLHAEEALRRLDAARVPGAPVTDDDGTFRGSIERTILVHADQEATLAELADPSSAIAAEDGLDDVLGTLADHGVAWAPVVADGKLVGILSARDVMRAYRRGLAGNVRQVRGLGDEGVLLEATLAAESPLVGQTIGEAGWPRGVVVAAVRRNGTLIIPTGATTLAAGDSVTVLSTAEAQVQARAMLA